MGGFRSRSESSQAQGKTPHSGLNSGHTSQKNRDVVTTRTSRTASHTAEKRRAVKRHQEAPLRSSGDKVRDIAFNVIHSVTASDAYANLLLPKEIDKAKLDTRDAAFATEITYGTLRATGQLDTIISAAAKRPVSKIDSVVLDILRLGAYQILRTRVDDYAAVNTSVELAKAHGQERASGFVNGVLRTIARTPYETWLTQLEPDNPTGKLALRYAHPTWIVQQFERSLEANNPDFTSEDLAVALLADDQRPEVHLAARPGKLSQNELVEETGGTAGTYSEYSVRISSGDPAKIPAVQEQKAHVQDEGSQLVALSLLKAPVIGEDKGQWLDLCAGPGGKAAFMGAMALTSNAHLDAVEIAEHRSKLIAQSVEELPVDIHTGDGRKLEGIPSLNIPEQGYDRILVDAPCSGLGSLRRRPEARWRKTNAEVGPLSSLQRELAYSAADALRPGGVMVYSTCSPHIAETHDIVQDLVAQKNLEVLDISTIIPSLSDISSAPYAQLWPHIQGTDAMFFAVLRKPVGE